jgi:hypothetical protein
MTHTALDAPETSEAGRRSRRAQISLAAGIGYSLAWLAGLAVFSSSTQVDSSGAQVLRAYTGHQGAATAQFALTEGVAALMLAVLTCSLAGALTRRAGTLRRLTLASGLAASAVSLVQCALGVWLTTALLPERHAATAGVVSATLNRLDGVKMLLLAALAAATAVAVYRAAVPLPGWVGHVAAAVTVTITLSAIGYLFLDNLFATAAWLSLPLLLIFVTSTAICLNRPRRHLSPAGAEHGLQ